MHSSISQPGGRNHEFERFKNLLDCEFREKIEALAEAYQNEVFTENRRLLRLGRDRIAAMVAGA